MTRQKDLSQLDPGGVLKSAHDFDSDTLRVSNGLSDVPSCYDRVDLTYNASGSVTEACFYRGVNPQIFETICQPDVSSSLNSTYFELYSGNSEEHYYVWYSVDGAGVDPAVSGAKGIKVDIAENDNAEVVSFATKQQLGIIVDFIVRQVNRKLIVENYKRGPSTSPSDSGTGFLFLVTQVGTEELIKTITPPETPEVTYVYNEIEKKFEISSSGLANVIIEEINKIQGLLAGVCFDKVTAAYPTSTTEVYTYTLATVQQAEITVIYTDNCKETIISAERTA